MTRVPADPFEPRVRLAVAAEASEWFPGRSAAVPQLISSGSARCSRSYRYDLGGPRIFVKVPSRASVIADSTRPRVLPLHDIDRKHEVEFAALRRVENAWREDPLSPLGPSVRALAVLDDPPALVMEEVSGPTLHRALRSALLRNRAAEAAPALRAVGQWLGVYHRLPPEMDVAIHPRLCDEAEVRGLAHSFGDHLASLAAHRRVTVDRLVEAVDQHAGDVVAGAVAIIHGDLAPGNLFVGPDGSVRAIDLTPWRAPALLDLAYLTVALRTSRLALLLPRGRRAMEGLVDALHDGYSEHQPEHERQVAGMDALIALSLLDKWAAVADRADASLRHGSFADRLVLGRVVAQAEQWAAQRGGRRSVGR